MNRRSDLHIIEKVGFEVHVLADEYSTDFNNDLQMLARSRLLSFLDTVFSEAGPQNEIIRIDRLDIDLGIIPSENFSDALFHRLSVKLRETLSPYICRYKNNSFYDSKENMVDEESAGRKNNKQPILRVDSIWDSFIYFLRWGYLPWYHRLENIDHLERHITVSLSGDSRTKKAAALKEIFTKYPNSLVRFVYQCSDQMVICAINTIYPSFDIGRTISELMKINEVIDFPEVKIFQSKSGRNILWQAAFQTMLAYDKKNQKDSVELKATIVLGTLNHIVKKSAMPHYLSALEKELKNRKEKYPHLYPIASLLVETKSNQIGELSDLDNHVIREENVSIPDYAITFPHQSESNDERSPQSLIYKKLLPLLKRLLNKNEIKNGEIEYIINMLHKTVNQVTAFNTNEISNACRSILSSLSDFKEKDKKISSEIIDRIKYLFKTIHDEEKRNELNTVKSESKYNREYSIDIQEIIPKTSIVPHEENDGEIFISRAGLVLLHAFLPNYFKNLEMVKTNSFINTYIAYRAVHLLEYMATGQIAVSEFDLIFHKILCGISVTTPIPKNIILSKEETTETEKMLNTTIKHWGKLKNTTIDGLRASFLLREGKIVEKEESWTLTIEQKGYDVLLDYIPWNISIVKLPWMKKRMHVYWA